MDLSFDFYANWPAWLASIAATAAAMATAGLYARRKRNAARARSFPPLLAATATVLLFCGAAYLWRSDERAAVAELEAALSAAHSRRLGNGPAIDLRSLRAHLEKQPRDARAWVLYARGQADHARFDDAALGYEKALGLSHKVARDPAVWCEYADAVAMTQGGRLAGRPRTLIDRALALDPAHPKALELAGSAEYEQNRYSGALLHWRALLAKLEPGTRMYRELAAAIERTELLSAATSAGESPRH